MAGAGQAPDPRGRTVQRLMLYGIPLSLLLSGAVSPLGVVLYWTTQNLFTFGQQRWIMRRFPRGIRPTSTPMSNSLDVKNSLHHDGPMTTTNAASPPRTTVLDRTTNWMLDLDGDMFGDERERIRWYEGITIAAGLQWLAVPWAAAVLVWFVDRAAVVPLGVVLAVGVLPVPLATLHVRRRGVDTAPPTWPLKRSVLTVLSAAPYPLFIIGAGAALGHGPHVVREGLIGLAIGVVLSVGYLVATTRMRRRRDTVEYPDVDV